MERVAEALVEILRRVGIPDEMLTDCGSQFTEEVMKDVSEPVHAKRYKLVKLFKICFFAENVRKLS